MANFTCDQFTCTFLSLYGGLNNEHLDNIMPFCSLFGPSRACAVYQREISFVSQQVGGLRRKTEDNFRFRSIADLLLSPKYLFFSIP